MSTPGADTRLYAKTVEHLSLIELVCLASRSNIETTPRQTKRDIAKNIGRRFTLFLSNLDRKFYFKRIEKKVILLPTPTTQDEKDKYPLKEVATQNRLDIEKIKNEIELEVQTFDGDLFEEVKEEPAEGDTDENDKQPEQPQPQQQQPKQQQPEEAEKDDSICSVSAVPSRIEKNSSTKHVFSQQFSDFKRRESRPTTFNQKIKFDAELGIEAFIQSVQSYCSANYIHDEERIIDIARAALNTSADGVVIQETLTQYELVSWPLFKARIRDALGFSANDYREDFDTFKRGDIKIGVAFAKLVRYYKRGYLSENEELDSKDAKLICKQFIRSFDQPLRTLLMAEEDTLTFSNIVNRAAHLERVYRPNREQIAAIHTPGPTQSNLDTQILELINSFKEQSELTKKLLTENSRGKGPRPRTYRPNPEGYCIDHMMNKCKRGSACRYSHSPAPAHVAEKFKPKE